MGEFGRVWYGWAVQAVPAVHIVSTKTRPKVKETYPGNSVEGKKLYPKLRMSCDR